jgi:hypothetical protein
MDRVVRLVTLVDVRDEASDAQQMSVSARQEAELADGTRVLLLDDRGWSASTLRATWAGEAPDHGYRRDHLDQWAQTSVEEIEETARFVVGPDEPFDGRSQEEMESSHWAYLAGLLREQGVVMSAEELKRLPHDVVLSDRLVARIGRDQDGTVDP